MFKLLKWTAIIFVGALTWYCVSFFLEMNDKERDEVKTGAIEALETTVLTGPLADKIRADLEIKKITFFEPVKAKLKSVIDKMMDSGVKTLNTQDK